MDDALDRAKVRELLELTGGEPSWLRDLLHTYVEDTGSRLVDLNAALRAGKGPLIQREAHGIKGASANIGAHEVARLCSEIEHHARDGRIADARASGAALMIAFQRVQDDIPRALTGA